MDITRCEPNTTLSDIFDSPVVIIQCLEIEKRRHFYAARTYYGNWAFEAVQLAIGEYQGGF